MAVLKISNLTKIKGQDFIKRVMVPATGKTAKTILSNYDDKDQLRQTPYLTLLGTQIPAAALRYHGKDLNMSVVEEKILQIDREQSRARSKQQEWELAAHDRLSAAERGQRKKADFERMRAEQADAQKAKLKKPEQDEKKRKIERTRASEQSIPTDLPID